MAQWVVLPLSSGSYNDNAPATTAHCDRRGGFMRARRKRRRERRKGQGLAFENSHDLSVQLERTVSFTREQIV